MGFVRAAFRACVLLVILIPHAQLPSNPLLEAGLVRPPSSAPARQVSQHRRRGVLTDAEEEAILGVAGPL